MTTGTTVEPTVNTTVCSRTGQKFCVQHVLEVVQAGERAARQHQALIEQAGGQGAEEGVEHDGAEQRERRQRQQEAERAVLHNDTALGWWAGPT